jgi:hypothetical protein
MFTIMRAGMDFRIKCNTCGTQIWINTAPIWRSGSKKSWQGIIMETEKVNGKNQILNQTEAGRQDAERHIRAVNEEQSM